MGGGVLRSEVWSFCSAMERGEEQQVAHILLHLRRLYRTTVIDTVLELPWMVATGIVLCVDRAGQHKCDKPLKTWLTVVAVLLALALPLRFVVIRKARRCLAAERQLAAAHLQRDAWALGTSANMLRVHRLLFLVLACAGTLFVFQSHTCKKKAPLLYRMTLAYACLTIGLAVLWCAGLVFFTWAVRRASPEDADSLLLHEDWDLPMGEQRRVAALASPGLARVQIDSLGSRVVQRKYGTDADADETDGICAICIEPLDVDQTVRELPCRHAYHIDCIDPWLLLNDRCPQCMQPTGADTTRASNAV